ncbi:TraR/DksA family transcriptional regulator [Oleidesulfovibrio sp.]|uniref:TraR/DksA family transcriptional regulator n=1 Tax=Oleidesulfovibrio sp. TaxID=2909707 RepID=UPI003A896606
MADILDMATDVERMQREAAIALVLSGRAGTFAEPDVIDGVPCCRECGEPIPAARLAAMPGAALCVDCAREQEQHNVY